MDSLVCQVLLAKLDRLDPLDHLVPLEHLVSLDRRELSDHQARTALRVRRAASEHRVLWALLDQTARLEFLVSLV